MEEIYTCSRCSQSKAANFFLSKKGEELRKVCSHCREQISNNNKKQKSLKQNDNLLIIELDELKQIITEKIRVNDHNCFYENENSGLEVKCILSTTDLGKNNKEIVNNIVKIIMEKDGYSYVHNNQHSWIGSDSITTYKFYCSQSVNLSKRPRKNLDIKKQRDREHMDRFSCNGCIKIVIDNSIQTANIVLQYDLLHIRPEKYNVSDEVKNSIRQQIHLVPKDMFSTLESMHPELTQKQVHYWWTQAIQEQYKEDDNQLISAQILLEKAQFNKLLLNITSEIQYLGFITPFFDQLKNNEEVVVDATYKTNALGFELYAAIGQIDGCGYPMAYLFLNNAKKSDGIRAAILTEFFQSIKQYGLTNLRFFLTDKDWAQINAARQVWPDIKVQLCLWHLKKAVKKRLADNTPLKINNYSASFAKSSVDFIDENFVPMILDNQKVLQQKNRKTFEFCPKNLREDILKLITKHLHLHPLIPNDNNEYFSTNEIWIMSVKEIYDFCIKHDLRYVWAYMWTNWYQKDHWILWARAANSNELCLFKTTMLIESHWKVIKRDFLPKFFRPRLDLVVFIIIKRLIPHHQQRQIRILKGREKPSWKKDFKREWRKLEKHEEKENVHITNTEKWICSCYAFLLSRWPMCYHLVLLQKDLGNDLSFFTKVKRQGVYPFLKYEKRDQENGDNSHKNKTCVAFSNSNALRDVTNDLVINNGSIQNNEEIKDGELIFAELETYLDEAKKIVMEQHQAKNYRWANSVVKNFSGMKKVVDDIKSYSRRITFPRTWKDHNENTMFLE